MIPFEDIICDQYYADGPVEVLVIGAGLSGLQLAKDLSKRNVPNVWVFEAGPNLGFQHIYWEHSDIYAQKLWQLQIEDPCFHRPWLTHTPPHYAGTSGLRRRLGGRSLYWHGAIIRLEPWVLDPSWWPESIVRDLTIGMNESPPLYELQEFEVSSHQITSGTKILVELIQSIGYTHAQSVPLAVRSQHLPDGDIRWAAYSPLDFWHKASPQLETVSDSKLPRIACNMEIVSILADRGKVKGVRARNMLSGNIVDINSPCIVLAAGTIENTRLALDVLWSGSHIERPMLSGLTDHLVTGCMYQIQLDHLPPEWLSSQMPSFAIIPGTETSRFNLFVSITLLDIVDRTILVDIWTMGEQFPQRENVVYLDPTQQKPSQAHVHVSLSRLDHEMIEHQQQALRYFSTELLQALGPSLSVMNQVQYVSPLGTVDHEGGTLPFGTIIRTTGEFIDIQGLYAIGPCTFPRMGAANPSLTTLALAKRTAYLL
jgi:putative NAD(P)-binding protein